MITGENLFAEARRIARMVDGDAFPETANYLEFISRDEALFEESAYGVASALVECDAPKRFPAYLVAFIEDLYAAEIATGNHDAMNDLGARYYCGDRGFEQDFGKAVRYYDMAAENGSRQAQENLGYCYYYGRSVERDYKKAFHYFALGAFDGHLISLYKIGDMYLNGYYVQKNAREAFVIYTRCLETMTEEAMKTVAGPVHLRLGDMYLNGLGTQRDLEQALLHYGLAEVMLFGMVKNGDFMYRKSLQSAIEGQLSARAALAAQLEEE